MVSVEILEVKKSIDYDLYINEGKTNYLNTSQFVCTDLFVYTPQNKYNIMKKN